MSPEQVNERMKLLNALSALWPGDADVHRFKLRYLSDQIEHHYGGWSVPVASGAANANAYELMNAISSLQRRIEETAHLEVSIVLDPGLN